jgi:hypothetical protein
MKILKFMILAVILTGLNSCSSTDDDPVVDPIVDDGPTISFTKRVLIEDYTGTWCGFCPRVSFGIEMIKEATDFAIPVAIHRGNDPFNFAPAADLENLIGLQGYPDARLNRLTRWQFPEPNNVSQVIALSQGIAPKLGLAMTVTVTNQNVNLTVKTKYGQNMEGTKLIVYVLENGLIYNQTNYTVYYGGNSVLVGFEHDHVLKATFTNILGDAVPDAESVYDNVYTKNYSLPIPSNITNAANIEFVAFVVGSNNKVINSRLAIDGDNQQFEVLE